MPAPFLRRCSAAGLVVAVLFLLPAPTRAQDAATGSLLTEIRQLTREAVAASRAGETAASPAAVKVQADLVFAAVWGMPSGLVDGHGAAAMHGWKTRWQVSGSEFDQLFVDRYGNMPPAESDVGRLGVVGRARAARAALLAVRDDPAAAEAGRQHAGHVVASLNNVIGWMMIDDGVTKGERQPRVDLTRQWDAPPAFWQSTADTGWLFEAFAQAINILKTDYAGDTAMARRHAAAMTALLEKCLSGVDTDGDGSVAPVMMEGGLDTALQHAGYGGFVSP